MIYWEIFEVVVLVPVLIAFDLLLLASILIFATSLLLRGIWKLAHLDCHRIIPLHLAIVAAVTVWTFATGLEEVIGTALQQTWRLLLGDYDGTAPLRILGGLWLCGFLGQLGRFLYQTGKLNRMRKRAGQPLTSPAFEAAKQTVGVKDAVCVEMDGLRSAGVFGLWRPVVFVPAGFQRQNTEDEQRMIFLHELYHLRCRDNWLHYGVQLLCRVFYMHLPIKRQLEALLHYRELRCDSYVMDKVASRTAYAQLLLGQAKAAQSAYPAFGGTGYQEMYARLQSAFSRAAMSRKKAAAVGLAALAAVLLASAPLYSYVPAAPGPMLYIEYTSDQMEGISVSSPQEADEIMETMEDYNYALYSDVSVWNGVLGSYSWRGGHEASTKVYMSE